MSEPASQIHVRDEQGVTCVQLLERRIVDDSSIRLLGKRLLELAQASPRPLLVIDFGGVEHLSSAALGVLISVHNAVKERGGQLRLCGIARSIFEVFRITKLDRMFQTCQTVEQAVQGLA